MSNKKKISKKEQNERLTNWYLINLSWGVVGILSLLLISKGYQNISTLLSMQPLMWVLTGIFAIGTITLIVLGKAKDSKRMNNYAILCGVSTLVALWLAFYNKLRPLMENVIRTILDNPNLNVSSYWNVRIPMIGIGVYLVVAFVWYIVTMNRK